MTYQAIASVVRQVAAVAAVVFGILTQALHGIHLPPSVSTALTVTGGVILAIEHYVADPSTGRPVPPAPPAP